MKLTIKYYWKEISDDGLVKNPEPVGPYYSPTTLNEYGYNSKEDALKDFERYCNTKRYFYSTSLFLFEEYIYSKDE